MTRPDHRQWLILVTGASLYAGLSVVWLRNLVPEPLRTELVQRNDFLILQGPPLMLLLGNRMAWQVYVAGTLLCAWPFYRAVTAQTLRKRIVSIGLLLIAWCIFGSFGASMFA
jgi:hypothetical protein